MNGINQGTSILQRILRKTGTSDLMESLVKRISLSDLQSLLLAVYNQRTASLTSADVLRQYGSNRFVKIAGISPLETMKFDMMAFSLLPNGFEILELSPVCPLGTCSVLGPVDQNNALTTVRNTEVCSDSTNVLALESAARKIEGRCTKPLESIKLCTSHRLTRGQMFEGPASFPHFRILSLTTSGRDRGNRAFEVEAMMEHIDYYLRVIQTAGASDYSVKNVRVEVITFTDQDCSVAEDRIFRELRTRHKDVTFATHADTENGGDYYEQFRFHIFATSADGTEYFLVDGGFTKWMQKLMNNRKERFMISGMGTERFLSCFGKV
ncbi:MAG: hypothetical protein HQM08_16455 [Candidatus Riflebacteria bacterium]|nr:hypothetical protein [Candidatus Riflebacteria bacterium]